MSDIIESAVRAISASTTDEAARQAVARVGLAFRGARAASKDRSAWDRVSPQSVVAAVEWCARHGLHPGSSPPTVYLVPQSGELQARVTHVGLATLAARAGLRLRSVPVAVGDEVELDFGLVIAHRRATLESDPERIEDLRGVIVCVDHGDGRGEVRLWVPRSVILQARTASRSAGSGPWKTHPVQMARAAAIRACFRRGDIVAERMMLPEEPEVIEAEAVTRAPGGRLAAAEARMLEGPADLWDAPEPAPAGQPAQVELIEPGGAR